MSPKLCAHCGERIVKPFECAVCHADLSDLAYHSGEAYALSDHVALHPDDDAHWKLLEDSDVSA